MSVVTNNRHDAVDHTLLEQAADWLVQMQTNTLCESEHKAWERWRQTSSDHARAWERAERLLGKLETLPPALAMPALLRKPDAARRSAAIKLLVLAMVAPVGWWSWRKIGSALETDFQTAIGERREVQLADGSRVMLNTDTAIGVGFDRRQRRVVLQRGEMYVGTAPDTAGNHRPFRVASQEGEMEALGTRFSVRQDEGRTHLAVFEGAVRIAPADHRVSPLVVRAGEQTWFTRSQIASVERADTLAMAWQQGMLVADNMRLTEFAAELGRYRPGMLRVESEVANLRVSGSYPIDDTDQTLAMLVTTYPVSAVTRFGGRWVTLVQRTGEKK